MPVATQGTAKGWHKLPPEIRLKIYRQSWQPRTVFVGIRPTRANAASARANEAHLPVTLHLNYEAREQTLRHYKRLQLTYLTVPRRRNDSMRWIDNYINPRLDILHLDGLRLEHCPGLIMSSIPPASLHVTLGRNIDPYLATKLFHYQVLPGINSIFDGIRTFDCWVTRTRPDMGLPRPANEPRMFPMTFRYRICRTSQAPKTKLVTYQDASWRALEHRNYECPEPSCRNPNSVWRWHYTPEENKPRKSIPEEKDYTLDEDEQLPMPSRRLIIPGAVSHWLDLDARSILKRDGALIFDSGGELFYGEEFGGGGGGKKEREWSVLQVMPSTLWGKEVIDRAFQHLAINNPLSMGSAYFPPYEEGDPHSDDDAHSSDDDDAHPDGDAHPHHDGHPAENVGQDKYVHPGMELHPDSAFRREVIPLFHNMIKYSGTSIESVQYIQGVCLPDYQLHDGCTAVPGDPVDYPTVSDRLEEEVLSRVLVDDLEVEDLGLREEFDVAHVGWKLHKFARHKTWHSCQ
ncbi:hypothetical protein B0T21DRAFT_423758 [Apiosordaria backusii]|uniref:2EXR domain-containing protein n=1 Tax=Apiosordaria backusii TaxID=314023 RepID=A0AA40E3K7_9PEZI|nr:hypothetical protein B0T21DRAFT_423758 [Apiosordaria backusii]